jgi:tetratricopeptide (TPR) repeat protein
MNTESLFKRGMASAEEGNYQTAISNFSEVLLSRPKDVEALYNRGVAYFSLNKNKQAIEDFTQVLSNAQEHCVTYVYRGIARYRLGDKQGALHDWSRSIAIEPGYAKAYFNRAILLAESGDAKGSLNDWNQLVAIIPNDFNVYMHRAILLSGMGDYQSTITDYERALQLNPNALSDCPASTASMYIAESFFTRGKWLYKQEKYQKAIDDLTTAISIGLLSDKRAKAYTARGVCYSALGNKQAAIKDYQVASAKFLTLGDHTNYESLLSIIDQLKSIAPKDSETLEIESIIRQLSEYVPDSHPVLKQMFNRGLLEKKSQENGVSVAKSLLQIVTTPRAEGLKSENILWTLLVRLSNPATNTQIINVPFSNGKTRSNTCMSAAHIGSLISNTAEYARIVQEITTPQVCFKVTRRYDDPKLFKAKTMWLQSHFSFDIVREQTLTIHVVPDENALDRAILEQSHLMYPDSNSEKYNYKNSRNCVDVLLQAAITNYAMGGNYDSSTDTDKTDSTSGVPAECFGALSLDYDILGIETVIVAGPAANDSNWISAKPMLFSPLDAYDSPL